MKDLVQIDADTAMLLYSKGLTHLPVLKRDGYSSDWTAAQPLYLDDIIEDLMIFVSDSERNKVLNPPKTDIAKVKEEIYLERRNLLSDDEDDYEDDDPDWTEEPAQVETIPDDDEVPEHERIRFTDKICFFACSNLGWCNQRTRCRHNSSFCRACDVRICTNKLCTVIYHFYGSYNIIIVIVSCFTHNYVIGVYVIH